jgi:site-specific recombinase XerC
VRVVERDLLPVFGLMRMNEILPLHVRDFVRRLQEQGVSACTVQRCKTVLSAIFTTVLQDRVIFLHPCTGVRVPAAPARPLRILTPVELEAIMAELPGEEWRLLVKVAIGSGVRWGELTELRVGDLDRSMNVLTVARAVAEWNQGFILRVAGS